MVAGVGARAALNTALKSKTDAVTSEQPVVAALPAAALPVAEVEEAAEAVEAVAACADPPGALALTEPAKAEWAWAGGAPPRDGGDRKGVGACGVLPAAA
jgi:hypothetical protein